MKTGKKIIGFTIALILSAIIFSGCQEFKTYYDNSPPAPPENVRTFVGDNLVEITWDYNRENDVAGYNIYYSDSYWGEYTLIGSTEFNSYVDYEAVNGIRYYYAVAAYDFNGNESELSYDEVYGVARPEGKNQKIYDYNAFPEISGYDFSEYAVVPFDENTDQFSADMFFENFDGVLYINVWDDTDIQDMGPTNDLYEITEAPLSGWVQLNEGENVKYVEAVAGHTYIIWTWDNHFAKIRIKDLSDQRMVFDWAYQLLEGEPQLKLKAVPVVRVLPNKPVKNK